MHGIHFAAFILAVIAAMALYNIPTTLTRKRKQADPSNKPAAPDFPVTFSIVSNKLRCTMPQPVSAIGLPHVSLTGGAHIGTTYPTAKTQVSLLVWDLTYANNVASGDAMIYPSKDPCFRSPGGGYAQPVTKTL